MSLTQKKIKVAMINIHSTKNRSIFDQWAEKNRVDFLVLTETLYNKLDYESTACYGSNKQNERVQIRVISDAWPSEKIYADETHVIAKIKDNFTLHAWYLPPKHPDLEIVKNTLRKGRKETIHLGDMNANSTWAGSKVDNPRGNALSQAAIEGKLVNLNTANIPTYHRAQTTPDWALVSPDIRDRTTFIIPKTELKQDHEIIVLEINTKSTLKDRETVIKPSIFIKQVTSQSQSNIDDWFSNKQSAIAAATKPKKSKAKTGELDGIIANINRQLKKIRREATAKATPPLIAKSECDKLRAHLSKARHAKKVAEAKAAEKSQRSRARKSIKIDSINVDGRTVSGCEAATLILQYHFPATQDQQLRIPHNLHPRDAPLTHLEVDTALKSGKNESAPGGDNISYGVLKQWHAQRPGYFHNLFNSWFERGMFPHELRESHLTLLSKDGTAEPDVSNTRPIGRLDTIGKWYEAILDKRITWQLEASKTFTDAQRGYREGISPVQTAYELVQKRALNKVQKSAEITVSMDIKSAFNNLKHQPIIDSMQKYQLPGNLVRIVVEYLTDRRVYLKCGEDTAVTPMRRGVVQGSVLGPHLFIMATNEAVDKLKSDLSSKSWRRATVIAYADDVVISLASAKGINDAIKKAKKAIKQFAQDLQALGLELQPAKTKILIANTDTKIDSVKILGQMIRPVDSFEFLGIDMNAEMRNEDQVKKIKAKVQEKLRDNHALLATRSKLSHRARKEIVETQIIPTATYGAACWFSAKERVTVEALNELDGPLKRSIAAANKRTGIHSATILSQTLPLRHSVAIEAETVRATAAGHLDGIQIAKRATISDRRHPSEWISINIDGYIDNQADTAQIPPSTIYYTDGSRIGRPGEARVGAAVVRIKDDQTETRMLKLPDHSTVFHAEAMAIREVLEWAQVTKESDISIISDSLSVLTALNNPLTRDGLILAITHMIQDHEKNGRVYIFHCRAHKQIQWNEEVDKLAKRATLEGELSFTPLQPNQARRSIIEQKWTMHENELKNQNWKSLKNFVDGPRDKRLRKMTINADTTQLYCNSHYRTKTTGGWGKCTCGASLNATHILTNCPHFEQGNVREASALGLSTDTLFGPWEDLKKHPKLHPLVAARAKEIGRALQAEGETMETEQE